MGTELTPADAQSAVTELERMVKKYENSLDGVNCNECSRAYGFDGILSRAKNRGLSHPGKAGKHGQASGKHGQA